MLVPYYGLSMEWVIELRPGLAVPDGETDPPGAPASGTRQTRGGRRSGRPFRCHFFAEFFAPIFFMSSTIV